MKNIFLIFIIMFSGIVYSTSNYEKVIGKNFNLYPAIEGKIGDKNCKDFFGSCMIFQTDNPVLALKDFQFKVFPKNSSNSHNQIHILLDETQSKEFERITEKYSGDGKRLAIVYENKILHSPKLRSKIKSNAIIIDFCNEHLFNILLASFQGKVPPDYKFSDDQKCNVCDVQ
jgi:hypothetical protein